MVEMVIALVCLGLCCMSQIDKGKYLCLQITESKERIHVNNTLFCIVMRRITEGNWYELLAHECILAIVHP